MIYIYIYVYIMIYIYIINIYIYIPICTVYRRFCMQSNTNCLAGCIIHASIKCSKW